MREKYVHAGKTVKIKAGVGTLLNIGDPSGKDFVIEDWCENVFGCSWMNANGNPAALEYAVRNSQFGDNNNVPVFSNDVVYGKISNLGFLFHINELELDGLTSLVKLKFLRDGEPSGREYTYISKSEVAIGDTVIVREAEEGKDAQKGIITAVNVPESEVESFKDKLKAIVGRVENICDISENE